MAKAKAKKKLGSEKSGIGLTITEMSDTHFKAHLSRVLGRMTAKGASKDKLEAASTRIKARRTPVSVPAEKS